MSRIVNYVTGIVFIMIFICIIMALYSIGKMMMLPDVVVCDNTDKYIRRKIVYENHEYIVFKYHTNAPVHSGSCKECTKGVK